MRRQVATTVALFAAFTLLTMPFLGTEALYVALVCAFLPLVPRVVRGDWGNRSREAGDESDGTSVWDSIPSRQYTGRYAESGGLARSEQEQAIEDVRRQASVEEHEDAFDR